MRNKICIPSISGLFRWMNLTKNWPIIVAWKLELIKGDLNLK